MPLERGQRAREPRHELAAADQPEPPGGHGAPHVGADVGGRRLDAGRAVAVEDVGRKPGLRIGHGHERRPRVLRVVGAAARRSGRRRRPAATGMSTSSATSAATDSEPHERPLPEPLDMNPATGAYPRRADGNRRNTARDLRSVRPRGTMSTARRAAAPGRREPRWSTPTSSRRRSGRCTARSRAGSTTRCTSSSGARSPSASATRPRCSTRSRPRRSRRSRASATTSTWPRSRPGVAVLDLGSGIGTDVFCAAVQVGAAGAWSASTSRARRSRRRRRLRDARRVRAGELRRGADPCAAVRRRAASTS